MAEQTTAYRTSEPNADITLYKGPITLSKDSHQVTSEGTLVLQWLPDPRVRLLLKDITSSTFPLFSRWIGEQPILTVADSTESACALVSSFEMDSESGGRVEGILNRALQVGRPEELGTAEYYLTNLADFSLSGPNDRMHLEAFEWEVEISAADGLNSLIKKRREDRGLCSDASRKDKTEGRLLICGCRCRVDPPQPLQFLFLHPRPQSWCDSPRRLQWRRPTRLATMGIVGNGPLETGLILG